ncbi:MAG: ATP-binding protein [Candidatus Promineofilum sp.]|nr:ATP-binding protein [Promineifilum sp.]
MRGGFAGVGTWAVALDVNKELPNPMDIAPPEAAALIANPFIVGRPLTGVSSSLYVGREDLFAWFDENLSVAGQPNALLLHGPRRIGKTSTLYQLVEGERGRPLREGRARRLFPAYIDLQRYAGRPTDEWLRRLARDIYRRVTLSGLEPSTPDDAVPGATAFAAFDRSLDRLEETLPDDGLILLAIDEFEEIRAGIEAGTLEPEVLVYLRSQIQHRARIVFLLCGSAALLEPFWTSLTNLTARYEVPPLDFQQSITLIRRPVEGLLIINDGAVAGIWEFTKGHPFLIQTICHRLVSLANRRYERRPIEAIEVEKVIEQMVIEGYRNEGWVGGPEGSHA